MLTLSLALVRAFLIRPDVPSRVRYPALFHTATPDLHMDHYGAGVVHAWVGQIVTFSRSGPG